MSVHGVVNGLGSPYDSPGVPLGEVGRLERLDLVVGNRPMNRRGGLERFPTGLVEVNLGWPRIVLRPQQLHFVWPGASLTRADEERPVRLGLTAEAQATRHPLITKLRILPGVQMQEAVADDDVG